MRPKKAIAKQLRIKQLSIYSIPEYLIKESKITNPAYGQIYVVQIGKEGVNEDIDDD